MSTAALIATPTQHTRINFDGRPDYTGKLLRQYYPTASKAEELVAGGELRSLWIDGSAEYYQDTERRFPQPNRAPGNIVDLIQMAEDAGCDYLYLFTAGVWVCYPVRYR